MHEWLFEDHDGEQQKTEKSASSSYKSELAILTERVKRNQRQLKEGLDRLQNSLDNLRLVTKYRVFDLEATRRENARLKKLLEGDDNDKPYDPGK
ncbi:MAG: hypothetical protein ACYSWO_24485 [Planctomycetota bacterium]|jgi:hypothetical protein